MDAKPDCSSKTKYANQKEADKDLVRIKKTSTRSNIPIRSYYCSICVGWHITSQESHLVIKLKAVSIENEFLQSENKRLVSENKRLSNENKSLIGRNKHLLNENIALRKKQQSPKTPPTSV